VRPETHVRKSAQSHGVRRRLHRDTRSRSGSLEQVRFFNYSLGSQLYGESGLDLFEEFREHHPAISVIIATGYGTLDIATQAIRMDAVDFLSKPVSLADLESAMERAWSRYQLVHAPISRLESQHPTEADPA